MSDTDESQRIRESLWLGFCPECGTGPYTVVAQHVRQAHGISAAELRDRAGLLSHATICDPDFSQAKRDIAVERQFVPPKSAPKGRRLRLTEAGRRTQAAKAHCPHCRRFLGNDGTCRFRSCQAFRG